MVKILDKYNSEDYVYDISMDGTVVNALGMNIISNTDGFNFKLPKTFRYTEDNPYISPGLSRVTTEGKKYVGFEADVAEFNDLYMKDFHYTENAVNKMGLVQPMLEALRRNDHKPSSTLSIRISVMS